METILYVTCGILLAFLLLVGGAVLGMVLVSRAVLKAAQQRRNLPKGYRWVDEGRLVEMHASYKFDFSKAAAEGELSPLLVEWIREQGYQDSVIVHMSGTKLSEIGVPNEYGRVAVFLQDQVVKNIADSSVEPRTWMVDPKFLTLEVSEQTF